jgi:enoyl-[acyl-carrier-protein] reductase (NADH)
MAGLLAGKRFLIAGVASKLSIAFGIAQALHREGAELAFTYPNEKLKNVWMNLLSNLIQNWCFLVTLL